jgi:SRSO17 transposase
MLFDASWGDEEVLRQVCTSVLPAIPNHGKVVCWAVEDTGFAKKGSHSVGLARQYCRQVGKQQLPNGGQFVARHLIAVCRSHTGLYLPEVWTHDQKRRKEAGIPKEVQFQTKPQIGPDQIRQAVAEGVPHGVVVAYAGYGNDRRLWS